MASTGHAPQAETNSLLAVSEADLSEDTKEPILGGVWLRWIRRGTVLLSIVATATYLTSRVVFKQGLQRHDTQFAGISFDNTLRLKSCASTAADYTMIPAPLGCDSSKTGIVSYVGLGEKSDRYVNLAVMLGLSLQKKVPQYCRICLVEQGMNYTDLQLLSAAGWNVIYVPVFHPSGDTNPYWKSVYSKINAFRVGMQRVLWMDADMYVFSSELGDVLQNTDIASDQVAMVKDKDGYDYNSGLILLRPSLEIFAKLHNGMECNQGAAALDQPLINQAFPVNKIVQLDPKFNVHGNMVDKCDQTVVAHFIAAFKPTRCDVWFMWQTRNGFICNEDFSLRCPINCERYFCALKQNVRYLTTCLQNALNQTDGCLVKDDRRLLSHSADL